MKYLQNELDETRSRLAYWRFAWDRHGAPLLDELAAVIDHLEPFSKGGTGEAGNLVTACNRCNIKKNDANAQAWSANNPVKRIKAKYGEPVNWDGLASVFLYFARQHSELLSRSEREWVRELERANTAGGPSVNVG